MRKDNGIFLSLATNLAVCMTVQGWLIIKFFSGGKYGECVSYLLSFLCCGRMRFVFLIFLVFCVVVGSGACFLFFLLC